MMAGVDIKFEARMGDGLVKINYKNKFKKLLFYCSAMWVRIGLAPYVSILNFKKFRLVLSGYLLFMC